MVARPLCRQQRSREQPITCSCVQPRHGACAPSPRPYCSAHVRACAPGGGRGDERAGAFPGSRRVGQLGARARDLRTPATGDLRVSTVRAGSHRTSPPGPCGLCPSIPRLVLALSAGPGAGAPTSPPRLPAIMLGVREAPAQRRMAGAPTRAIWSALFEEEGTKLHGVCEC